MAVIEVYDGAVIKGHMVSFIGNQYIFSFYYILDDVRINQIWVIHEYLSKEKVLCF